MPTPLQILLEALFPARPLPRVKGWRIRALVVFVFYFYLSSYLPLLWGDTLAQYQLFNLESLNPFVGAAIGVLLLQIHLSVPIGLGVAITAAVTVLGSRRWH